MTVAIFTVDPKPVPGSVAIPYKGYDISLSTLGRCGHTAVFPSRESVEILAEFDGATAASLLAAFKWVDENPKEPT